MKSAEVVPGYRVGRLVVVKRIRTSGKDTRRVKCRCDCGNMVNVHICNLCQNTLSCGCLNREQASSRGRARNRYGKYAVLVPGAKLGRLTIVRRVEENGRYTRRVECKCSCGLTCFPLDGNLVSGDIRSCGCLRRETTAAFNKATKATYGGISKDPEWSSIWHTWRNMKERCQNVENSGYRLYGAKGIRVCQFLNEDPRNLLALLGPKPSSIHSIDRFPLFAGSYTCGACGECNEKGWKLNVRWATRRQQSLNKTNNVRFTAFGRTLTCSQWSELSGIAQGTITQRVGAGRTVEEALTKPDWKGNYLRNPKGVMHHVMD